MKIGEILLPRNLKDRSLNSGPLSRANLLKKVAQRYSGLLKKATNLNDRSFYSLALKHTLDEIKVIENTTVTEATHRIPITDKDFDHFRETLSKPIPAAVADIYLQDLIEDDELMAELAILADTEPSRDVRPIAILWFKQTLPDQIERLMQKEYHPNPKTGMLSPIHGLDPHEYKSESNPITGNAFGKF